MLRKQKWSCTQYQGKKIFIQSERWTLQSRISSKGASLGIRHSWLYWAQDVQSVEQSFRSAMDKAEQCPLCSCSPWGQNCSNNLWTKLADQITQNPCNQLWGTVMNGAFQGSNLHCMVKVCEYPCQCEFIHYSPCIKCSRANTLDID